MGWSDSKKAQRNLLIYDSANLPTGSTVHAPCSPPFHAPGNAEEASKFEKRRQRRRVCFCRVASRSLARGPWEEVSDRHVEHARARPALMHDGRVITAVRKGRGGEAAGCRAGSRAPGIIRRRRASASAFVCEHALAHPSCSCGRCVEWYAAEENQTPWTRINAARTPARPR